MRTPNFEIVAVARDVFEVRRNGDYETQFDTESLARDYIECCRRNLEGS